MAKLQHCMRDVLVVLVVLLLAAHVEARRPSFMNHPKRFWNILDRGADRRAHADLSVAGLEYYVQLEVGGPEYGTLIPAINSTISNSFGETQLFAFNVTEGADPTSKQLGYVHGFNVQASYTSVGGAGVEVEILSYNDGTLNGTISIQGLITNGPNEVAIVGGTGDFRGVTGYGIITFVNATDTFSLFHHELHFL